MTRQSRLTRVLVGIGALVSVVVAVPQTAFSQPPAPANGPARNGPPPGPMTIAPDPRVQQKSYRFAETGEEMKYTLFVSSRVKKGKPAPLIVALHGLGGDSNFIVRDRLIDLAEEGGYVVVGPMGYTVGGWYGSPVVVFGNQPITPPNLTELSEKDVMNVLDIALREFTIDPDRVYLMGHSMGGAGTLFLGQKHARRWAALAAIAPAAFLMQRDQRAILAPIKEAGLGLIITQGDKDPAVPVQNTRTWANAAHELGIDNEYVEMPGRDHGNIIGDGMPEIFRFFAAHSRKR
jgi:predicted peptidase